MIEASVHCWDEVIGPEERLISKQYLGTRRLGERPGLVLIDLYNQVFGDRPEPLATAIERHPSACGLAAWDAIPAITAVLDEARAAGLPIAHTTGETRQESQLGGATLRRHDRTDRAPDAFQPFDPFQPVEGEFVVRKSRASAFFGTPLSAWLRTKDVDTIIVVGESTSGCVRASVVDAFSHGLVALVCEEGVFDRSPIAHRMSLFDIHHKYGTVAHLPEVLQYIRGVRASARAPAW